MGHLVRGHAVIRPGTMGAADRETTGQARWPARRSDHPGRVRLRPAGGARIPVLGRPRYRSLLVLRAGQAAAPGRPRALLLADRRMPDPGRSRTRPLGNPRALGARAMARPGTPMTQPMRSPHVTEATRRRIAPPETEGQMVLRCARARRRNRSSARLSPGRTRSVWPASLLRLGGRRGRHPCAPPTRRPVPWS